MIEEKISLKNIDETKKYFAEEIKQNELISKNHEKLFKIFNYTEHLASTVTGRFSISPFGLVGIPVGIGSSAVAKKNYVVTAVIKKFKSIIKKKKYIK